MWELVNTTPELHNFHIHQGKFRLSRPGDGGAPPELASSGAIVDPTNWGAAYFAGGMDQRTQAELWHDTIPVPPADASGTPGWVFITVPFASPQQAGWFVFHCHILEHEDGGMMASIQVLDPAHLTAQVSRPAPPSTMDVTTMTHGSIRRLHPPS